MKYLDEIKGAAAILVLAEKTNTPPEEIESAIRSIIDEAWSSPDAQSRTLRASLFRGEKPTPAQFVGRLARAAK